MSDTMEMTTMNQYLTFVLGEEEYAFKITQIREVLDYTTITKVPRTPDFLCGVINLRGSVVAVVDLRLLLGMESKPHTSDMCIVIAEVNLGGEEMLVGALTDSVQEVIELNGDAIDPPPRFGARMNTDFIQGMGKRNDRFIIILDIDRIFTEAEKEVMFSSHATASSGSPESESEE